MASSWSKLIQAVREIMPDVSRCLQVHGTAARVGVEVVELDQRVTMTLGDELVFVY